METADGYTTGIISPAHADTDLSIGYLRGVPIAVQLDRFPEDDGDDVVGYYYEIGEEYVYNPYEGYFWWVENGEWCSSHAGSGPPEGRVQVDAPDAPYAGVDMDREEAQALGLL